MSFSYSAKAELCRAPLEGACSALAECYGMLLYGNTFSPREIKIITGSRKIGERIIQQFGEAFGINFDIIPGAEVTGKQAYIINDSDSLKKVFEAYGL